MQTSSVCDPSRPAALSPLLNRPYGIPLYGIASIALGGAIGALLKGQGGWKAVGAAGIGLAAAGSLIAASSPDATQWIKQTQAKGRQKLADRQERSARKAAEAGFPVAVAVPVPVAPSTVAPASASRPNGSPARGRA